MRRVVLLVALLAFVQPAGARLARAAQPEGPVLVEVSPAKLAEGRRATLEVTLRNTGKEPRALLGVTVRLGRAETTLVPLTARGLAFHPAGPGAVTFEATITEGDIGPMGRAPLPPASHELGDRSFRRAAVLGAGKAIAIPLDATAIAGDAVTVTLTMPTLASLAADPDAVLALEGRTQAPGPAGVGDPNLLPGPPSVAIAIARWRPWRTGDPCEEVLLPPDAGHDLAAESRTLALDVTPAAFPAADAITLAKVPRDQLQDLAFIASLGAWAFDGERGGLLLVLDAPGKAKPLPHAGKLAALARVLDAKGEAALTLSGKGVEELCRALNERKIEAEPCRGKPTPTIRIKPDQLVAFIETLEARGWVVDARLHVTPRPPRNVPGPAAGPPPEQGVRIPCLDCKVLAPGQADCKTCGGSGTMAFPARMLDATGQFLAGKARRLAVDEAVDKAQKSRRLQPEHDAAVGELRRALSESWAYGPAWAAGYDGRATLPDERVAEALRDAVRAQLRLANLEIPR